MKKTALAAVATLGLMGQSLAADLPARMPVKAPPLVAPAYNWNGFYVGANVGYGWDVIRSDGFNSAGVFQGNTKHYANGVFGGGQIGYNWQFAPNWLLGIEADAEAADIKGSISSSNSKIDDFGTIRGRFGYVANNVLLYGTGGWAWSHSKSDRTVFCIGVCPGGPSQIASASGSQSGWAAGAGIEWGFLPNWTMKVEYLHLQFDDVVRDYNYVFLPVAFQHTISNHSVDTIRIGVNYLFSPGLVVARY